MMNPSTISIEKLDGQSNWVDWKFQIRIQLQAFDAMQAVQGNLTYPTALTDAASAAEIETHNRNVSAINKIEYMAQNLIVSSLSSQVRQLVNMCNSAKDMWEKLHSIYEQRTEQRQDRLFNQFFGIREKDPLDSIAKHIAKLEKLWVELQDETWKEDKVKLPESLFLNRILNTLPAEYFEFMNAWESVPKRKRTATLLCERLCTVEIRLQERENGSEAPSSTAFLATDKVEQKNSKLTKVNKTHSKKDKTKYKCYSCNKRGHFKRDCPEAKTTVKKELAKAFVAGTQKFSYDESVWIADSGATKHMTNCKEWFKTWEPFLIPQMVLVGNGQYMEALGKGRIDVEMLVDGKWNENYLINVWYVPKVGRNLFSILSAVDKGVTSTLDNKRCVLMKDSEIVANGIRKNDLYIMQIRVIVPKVTAIAMIANSVKVDKLQLWHERLGHQNKRHVQEFLRNRGINVTVNKEFCEACMYGKQHRLSFGQRQNRAEKPGDLIYADVCGPMPKKSLGGARYFLIFKDDFTKFRSVYFLKEKSDVTNKLKIFLAEIKVQGHVIKELLTDGGKEFVNSAVNEITNNAGLHHRVTMPFTPEQNGGAEREIRTLVELARTMMHAKNFPEELWGEAVNTATYILNRTAPTSVYGKSPIELWTKLGVSVDHLKIFGTECFIHVPKQKRQKWDRKSMKGYLVGYCDNKDGFRIWIPNKRDVILSRDVVFKDEVLIKENGNTKLTFTLPLENDTYTPDYLNMQNKDSEEELTTNFIAENNESGSTSLPVKLYGLRDRSKLKKPEFFNEFAMLAVVDEPKTVKEALSSSKAKHWKDAMDEEMQSLIENGTWKLVELPLGRKTIANKWVFCTKKNKKGDIIRYKARLVAKGFSQKEGIDFEETFAPVARFDTIRTLLATAAAEGLHLAQFDIKTAFLYGYLEEEIYMKQPDNYEDGTARVCKLIRSLYGLKQAPRCWNQRFTKFLKQYGLRQSSADPCLFLKNKPKKIILVLYVDDGLIASEDEGEVKELLKALQTEFKITIDEASSYLGMQINKLSNGDIFIHQEAYCKRVLERFRMNESNPVVTPMEKCYILGEEAIKEENLKENVPFRSAVGSLLYLAVVTRPDISFAVNSISQALTNPNTKHWEAVKRIFKYLRGTMGYGIHYRYGHEIFEAYCDADYAGDVTTRRSTSGVVCKLSDGAISWISQKQRSVSLSTTEAEYIAGSEAAKEIVWLKKLLNEITEKKCLSPVLNMDNASAIKLIKNPEFHKRSKHIEVRYNYIREKVVAGEFDVMHVASENQIADIFTKPLARIRFVKLRSLLGVSEN